MDNFLKWLIILLICFVVSSVIIDYLIFSTYQDIENVGTSTFLQIDDLKIRANKSAGTIKGKLVNNKNKNFNKVTVISTFVSKDGTDLGSEKLVIDNMNKEDKIDFEMKFKFSDVAKYRIETYEGNQPLPKHVSEFGDMVDKVLDPVLNVFNDVRSTYKETLVENDNVGLIFLVAAVICFL